MRNMTPLSPDHERLIDDWPDRYATFVFQLLGPEDPPVLQPAPVGLFNEMMRHWQIQWATDRLEPLRSQTKSSINLSIR